MALFDCGPKGQGTEIIHHVHNAKIQEEAEAKGNLNS